MTVRLEDAGVELRPDPARVVTRLFLHGEGIARRPSRAGAIVRRLGALTDTDAAELADEVVQDFSARHGDLRSQLLRHADTVAFRADVPAGGSDDRAILIGAAFTAEQAVEAAALCNPSAFPHPDQSGIAPDELRVAIALRSIGEGHLSSIGFASAVVGVDSWRFEPRALPLTRAATGDGPWSRMHFRRALSAEGPLNQLSNAVVRALPTEFSSSDIERAIVDAPADLTRSPRAHDDLEALRALAWSSYSASFDPATQLSQRVLLPVAEGESHGLEDARFVRFSLEGDADEYRGSYTAYDGRTVAPRLLRSPDLVTFSSHRLVGDAATTKGMAFFPRAVGGDEWALTRTDGENISVARSQDGLEWAHAAIVHEPTEEWEVVQVGNCGSPLETSAGWLVLTHGVGVMRRYAVGALLLDLDDPTRVVGRLREPLLQPLGGLQEGYVPNVVYSCGGLVHAGRLWLPYGVGDQRVRVASLALAALLAAFIDAP